MGAPAEAVWQDGMLPNYLEVQVGPLTEADKEDVFFSENDSLIVALYAQDSAPSAVGVGMNFHSVKVAHS